MNGATDRPGIVRQPVMSFKKSGPSENCGHLLSRLILQTCPPRSTPTPTLSLSFAESRTTLRNGCHMRIERGGRFRSMIGVAAEGTNCRVCSSCGSKQSKILPPGAVKVPPTKEHQRHLSKTQAKKFISKASTKACARVPSLILIIAAQNEREIDGQHQHSRHRHKKKKT